MTTPVFFVLLILRPLLKLNFTVPKMLLLVGNQLTLRRLKYRIPIENMPLELAMVRQL